MSFGYNWDKNNFGFLGGIFGNKLMYVGFCDYESSWCRVFVVGVCNNN